MLTIVFAVCTAGGTFCEDIAIHVPIEHMSPIYCQMRGGLETAQMWVARHPHLRISGRVRCIDGVHL